MSSPTGQQVLNSSPSAICQGVSATHAPDTRAQALVYAIDLGERWGKVVVQVNYNERGRFDGVRTRIVSNFVQTGGVVDLDNILSESHMVPLKK